METVRTSGCPMEGWNVAMEPNWDPHAQWCVMSLTTMRAEHRAMFAWVETFGFLLPHAANVSCLWACYKQKKTVFPCGGRTIMGLVSWHLCFKSCYLSCGKSYDDNVVYYWITLAKWYWSNEKKYRWDFDHFYLNLYAWALIRLQITYFFILCWNRAKL